MKTMLGALLLVLTLTAPAYAGEVPVPLVTSEPIEATPSPEPTASPTPQPDPTPSPAPPACGPNGIAADGSMGRCSVVVEPGQTLLTMIQTLDRAAAARFAEVQAQIAELQERVGRLEAGRKGK